MLFLKGLSTMKRKITLSFIMIAVILLLFVVNVAVAYIYLPSGYYGWLLGTYNYKTQTFSSSSKITNYLNKYTVRILGPWKVKVGNGYVGDILQFNDVNSSEFNGYPNIGQDQWDTWIDFFQGNPTYVKSILNNTSLGYSQKIYTPNNGLVVFANFSKLAELCGGKGLSYNTENAYSTYVRTPRPVSTFYATKYAIKPGETINFNITARTYSEYGKSLYVIFENMNDGYKFINGQSYPGTNITLNRQLTLNTPGDYTFRLIVWDALQRYAYEKYIKINVAANPVPPPQPPAGPGGGAGDGGGGEPPPVDTNSPPTAIFGLPSSCYEGDTVDVGESSFDLDGQVVKWEWDHDPSFAGTYHLGKGGGELTIETTGKYDFTLTVTDDDGATDTVTHSIEVRTAKPEAVISYSGTLKENRKVTLNSVRSTSSNAYPIDHSRDEWTITPVSGGAAADIKYGSRSGAYQDVLFKKAGTYRVGLRVHNSKYDSEWVYKDIIIVLDDPPLANFFRSAIAFRNPAVSNYVYITLNDRTFSLDGDNISQRNWKYKYDSDNDGSFLDETFVTLDTGNNIAPVMKVNKVGKYLVELDVKESFGQPTIPEFITEADYRKGDTLTKPQADKIIDVQNIAPVTSFTATLKPKVDIIFSQGYMSDYFNRFPAMINNLEAILGSKLAAKNVDYAFYNTTVAPKPASGTINKTASSPWSSVKVDLGETIPIGSITNFSATWTCSNTTGYVIKGSENGTDWFTIERNWYYWGIYWGNHADGISHTDQAKGPPIESIRYISFSSYYGSPGAATLNVSVTYDKSYNRYHGWLIDGAGNYMAGSDVNQGPSNDVRWDLGQVLSSSMLRNSYYKFWFQSIGGDEDALGHLTVTAQTSLDNVNWTTIKTTSYTGDERGNLPTQYVYPVNSNYPSKFRYFRLLFNGDSGWLFLRDAALFLNYTVDSMPHATLADIQAKAEQTYRSDASKVIVSLAEEPYTDSNATTLTNTANSLINKNASFVAFANAGGTSSVQQLTSKLNKQTIITTTSDMSVPLSQLADYINNSVVAAPLSGTIHLLLGQSVAYNPTYSDYENDPKVTDNWNYVHDSNFVDNNTGVSFYHNKVLSGPVENLDKVGKYDVQYKAQDDPANADLRFLNYRMWSDPTPTNIIVHRKPVADFGVQAGTVNVTDHSYDPDFQFRRPDKGIVQWLWKWRPTSSAAWTNGKPSGITGLGTYVVHLEVKDVYGAWSDPVEKTITVTTLQRPPVADFNWTPAIIYEGDTVTLNNLSTDPDGDPLTYLWTVFNPVGATSTYTTKNVTLNKVLPGTYWVTLRAADPGGMSDAVTKSFEVQPLGITGYVKHTDLWNNNRIQYNRHFSGTDESPRPYNTFWAGEQFVLQAETTDTGLSATKAQSVTVEFLYPGVSVSLSPNTAKTWWNGEMWQEDFENIPDGSYVFRFKAVYSNGTVKIQDVPVLISGVWLDYFKFHRNW